MAHGHQAPLSEGFSRQEYWSGLLCPSPGDLPEPDIKLVSLALTDGFFTTSATWEAPRSKYVLKQMKEEKGGNEFLLHIRWHAKHFIDTDSHDYGPPWLSRLWAIKHSLWMQAR